MVPFFFDDFTLEIWGDCAELKFRLFSASSIWKDTFKKFDTAASEFEDVFSFLKMNNRVSERISTWSFVITPFFSGS